MFICLNASTSDLDETDYRFVKQRTDVWFSIRKTAMVTGSMLNVAIGLGSLMKQLEHYDNKMFNKDIPEFTEVTKQRMEHGVKNEINAVATIVAKVLPVFFPELVFYEEGCYKLVHDTIPIIVSPDGSCRNANDKPLLAIEIKCPAPKEGVSFKTSQHYSLPKYYVPQVLSEMAALEVDTLLYVCYSSDSTTVQVVTFSIDLWSAICSELKIYDRTMTARPIRRPVNVPSLQKKIAQFIKSNVSLLCEIASCKAINCQELSLMSAVFCKHVPDLKPPEQNHLRTIQTWLHECEIKLESTYNLTRTRASEFLGFMISDVDRNYREEELHSIPIAYAMKGYSLSNQVMRNMMEFVLAECAKRGLYTPVCCFDGQWYKMTVRDGNDSPLTLLQLQKQIWNDVKKIDKKEILKEISNSNVVCN
jgi:hypothetical protein